MGLTFAKMYLQNMNEKKQIPVRHAKNEYVLNQGDFLFLNDHTQIRYANNKVELVYGSENKIYFCLKNGILKFTIVESENTSKDNLTVIYPLHKGITGIHVEDIHEDEHKISIS
jgi:hypothetical protein